MATPQIESTPASLDLSLNSKGGLSIIMTEQQQQQQQTGQELLVPPLSDIRTLAETAYWIMHGQSWNELGTEDPAKRIEARPSGDAQVLVYRLTALLACRAAAVVAPLGTYSNLAVATIAQEVMMMANGGGSGAAPTTWPLNPTVVSQLSEFVRRMVAGYKNVPYHNMEHAYHVVISTCKLVDLLVLSEKKKTYGLKQDPLALLALAFAALCHDVEHQGIPNRQLAMEDDRLAVLYNDQSMAENWSLYVMFSEFLQDEFQQLRETLLPDPDTHYRRFRRIVVNLVLTTDIASPERTQIGKSKWKEAFGDPFETLERKYRDSQRRFSMTGRTLLANRRGSAISAISHHEETDDSFSGTPENSETEELLYEEYHPLPKQLQSVEKGGDIGSPGKAAFKNRFERRLSAASNHTATSKYRQRLGILRTVDLSGETLETYERRGSANASVTGGNMHNSNGSSVGISLCTEITINADYDEPDDLKAAVTMETIMTAADVAHNLQGWEQMVKWSGRLYMELRRAYVAKRGSDPQEKWFENQIGFLESYLLPLARRLEDTGVFSDDVGQGFAAVVEANRDKWLTHGFEETQKVIAAGEKRYPLRKK